MKRKNGAHLELVPHVLFLYSYIPILSPFVNLSIFLSFSFSFLYFFIFFYSISIYFKSELPILNVSRKNKPHFYYTTPQHSSVIMFQFS